MAESSTIITLQQMCDLALNTPEIGIVNFNILRALLQVMIKQLGLIQTQVEYRGTDSERLQSFIAGAKPGGLTLTEYAVTPETKDQAANTTEGQIILVQSDHSGSEAQFTVTLTKEYFDQLEGTVAGMKEEIKELQELPGNLKIMENLKDGNNTPVLDMFQLLNVQKRMDAVEQGMEKLASLMESIGKGSEVGYTVVEGGEPSESQKNIVQRIEYIESKLGIKAGDPDSNQNETEFSMKRETESYTNLKQDVSLMKEMLSTLQQEGLSPGEGGGMDPKLTNLELKYNEFVDQLNSLDTGFSRLTSTLQTRIEALEKENGEILEKVHLMPSDGEGGATQSSLIAEMRTQLLTLQDELENIDDIVKKLTDERENKEHTMDILVEQIELLKTVKADREDLEDALADKADACQINRKVSYEQFDQACGDMAKSIEEAIGKLTQQEQLWTQALTNIQNEVGGKMDKNELNPLRDFINSKLKGLQEKFKALTAMKKEQEAAGTKSKFLRNVNCISCDKDVVMRREMDVSLTPQPYAVPPTKSMGPYLAYELDQLRKQKKPPNKNMNMFENAILSTRASKSPDHICNRYCGGSHTVITPHQRVTRLGHFMEQWGPEIAPVNDGQIRGTDGKLYKARDDEQLNKLAAEKAPSPGGNEPVLFITPDPQQQGKSPSATNAPVQSEHAPPTNIKPQPNGNKNGKPSVHNMEKKE